MANSKISQLKLISESFVKPKTQVNEVTSQPYHHYLGPVDLACLSFEYIQQGVLYTVPAPQSASHQQSSSSSSNINIETFLEKLHHSLSLSLVHFYPLAGRLSTEKFPDDHASLIFVDCTKGPGARILHASLNLNASDLLSPKGHVSPIVKSLFDLGERMANHDGHVHPLLSIQVTELLDGVFIGFSMNHALADGTSFWHFISVLSKITLTQSDLGIAFRKPIVKPFLLDGHGPIIRLPYLDPEEFVIRLEPEPLKERIFHFSPASMAKLKANANEECGVHCISSFQALSGLLWRSITRARKLEPSEKTNCTLVVNARSRFNPPFTEDCFANFICVADSWCTAGELLGKDLGWAAMMVHKSVAAQNEKAIRESLDKAAKTPIFSSPGAGRNKVLIAGSSKFDMYGPEFGFGRGVAVLSGYTAMYDGRVIANPGCEGGGSVDLDVKLRPKTMSALESDEEFMSYAC